MIVFQNPQQLRSQVKQWRDDNESIAFVPTMGNLHAGHLSLVELAQQYATRVIVSIYVNPLQFAPDEDFASYPRTMSQDEAKLEALGIDLLFTPDTAMIYPEGEQQSTFVEVPALSHIIEGKSRPGFFRGVATVVLKLFNMVQPDIAVFGEKDFQQLLIIRHMVRDLNLGIEIIGGEIKREPGGLAMSSRNNYLSESQRQQGQNLSLALQQYHQQIVQGEDLRLAEDSCIALLTRQGFEVDYVTLRETSALNRVSDKKLIDGQELIILAAAKIAGTRLLDNLKFTV